jgi:hypothetical protein
MSDLAFAGSSAGASYKRQASFTNATSACVSTRLGACTVDPCYLPSSPSGATSPSVGQVDIAGAEMTSFSLEPQDDGSYPSKVIDGQSPWNTGGEVVTVTWAHLPGDPTQAGGTISSASPPYIELVPEGTFGVAVSGLSRAQDLALAWTSDSLPSVLDQVLVDLTSGSTQVVCEFDASAGTGTVPASVLAFLSAGDGSFDVHSKEYTSVHLTGADGAAWSVGFNVDAHARTSDGLAFGAITFW